jgi:hypothetical protein
MFGSYMLGSHSLAQNPERCNHGERLAHEGGLPLSGSYLQQWSAGLLGRSRRNRTKVGLGTGRPARTSGPGRPDRRAD